MPLRAIALVVVVDALTVSDACLSNYNSCQFAANSFNHDSVS